MLRTVLVLGSVLCCVSQIRELHATQHGCVFQGNTDCDLHDSGPNAKNVSSILTAQVCCSMCAADPGCNVSVYIPNLTSETNEVGPYGEQMSACLFKSSCPSPSPLMNRVKCCQPGDVSCPVPHPPSECPCAKCPCQSNALPRTCDVGSVSASLPFCNVRLAMNERVQDLIQRLTREEKINLVEQADTGFLPRLNLKEFNFFNTCLHGWWTSNVTTFGMPAGLAATFDTDLMKQVSEVIGVEGRAMSQRDYNKSSDVSTGYSRVAYNWLVCKDASEVNMNRHPLWGRNPETYGEDPYLTAQMGEAFTKQLQQPVPNTPYVRTTAVTRHLVVYSGPESLKDDNTQGQNRFSFNANVSDHDLEDYFYPPFEACIDQNRGNSFGAMCSDAAQNGVPSCASELLMKIMPRKWNASERFFVVSDMGSYYNVYKAHAYRANTSDALLTDLQAGLDILYLRGGPRCRDHGPATAVDCPDTSSSSQQVNETHDALETATNGSHPDSRFTLTDLDSKAAKALRLRFDLGEFDPIDGNPYALPLSESVIDSPEHRKVAREATAASVVVLTNNGVLPLAKTTKVAAIGPWIRPSLQASMGSTAYVHAYAGSSSVMVDILDGLNEKVITPINFVQGCRSNDTSIGDSEGTFKNATEAAAAADVTILALGLTAHVRDKQGVGQESEMVDRLSLNLPQVQIELLAAVKSVAKKLVLVIVAGSAVPFNETGIDAAVYAIYGGEEAGNGLADVLFGDVPPTGRLPFTVFKNLKQIRPMGDYDITTQPGRTHLYYSNESISSLGAPQFWFGHGLTYSTFEYNKLSLSQLTNGCGIVANMTVTNIGSVSSREVVQLYISRPATSPETPLPPWALRGFQRTSLLSAGQSIELSFVLTDDDLSTVLNDASRVVSSGIYTVSVGGGSPRDDRLLTPTVTATIQISSCA